MNFYEYIHILCYISIYLGSTRCLNNKELKIVQTGVEPVNPCAVGLKFYVIVNNTSILDDYDVELVADQCCLEAGSGLNCNVLEALGNCVKKVPRGTTSTLNLIAPILDPYERKGYCLAYLDSKAAQRKRKAVTMRDAIKIPFDTRINISKRTQLPTGLEHCKGFDEDPLNHCQPVDCEMFYNGKKSFYNKIQKRCVEVPYCVSEGNEIPNTVYDPKINKCSLEDPVTTEDIDYIKDLGHFNRGRIVKDIVIIKKLHDSPVNMTDLDYGTEKYGDKHFSNFRKQAQSRKDWYGNTILCFVQKNKSSVAFLFMIIVLQCAMICLMIYFMARRCTCKKTKKLEKTYFNYRQDASVTTPLIGITTAETETETTCQFMSESSHIDKKIQCYKACQKENAKFSLSDDILAKCLNRRNWDRKQVRSEAVDAKTDTRCDGSKTFDTLYMSTRKEDQKMNYEHERDVRRIKNEKKGKPLKSIVKKEESKKKFSTKINECNFVSELSTSEHEIQCISYKYKESQPRIVKKEELNPDEIRMSEQEIKCHSYNYGVECSDSESIKVSSHSYSDVKSSNKEQQVSITEFTKGNSAVSIGRPASAQASFSNDSIDDFLSERGVFFLNGENISKYSFSDGSIKSSASSRTSKNFLMKHVLSYLKRDKHGPSSDPGGKKNDDEVNLELIHMSKATMYSSSNNETECMKNITKGKDSRTSL